ncbi:MAG: antibiotic biosynthesis monooxygenase family protein [Bacteroidota bacterium]
MYMRMVRARVKAGQQDFLRSYYEKEIITQLARVPGCLYVGLLNNTRNPEEVISMTLWESQERSDAYARSPLFTSMLASIQPFLIASAESRLQLSEDFTLEFIPVEEKPVIENYSVEVTGGAESLDQATKMAPWVRIVLIKIAAGKVEEFKKIYTTSVVSALRTVKGCRHVFLSQSAEHPTEFISTTVWDSLEEADAYDHGGLFKMLMEWMKHTLPDLYQWKMDQQAAGGSPVITSEELVVENYTVMTAKSFGENQ